MVELDHLKSTLLTATKTAASAGMCSPDVYEARVFLQDIVLKKTSRAYESGDPAAVFDSNVGVINYFTEIDRESPQFISDRIKFVTRVETVDFEHLADRGPPKLALRVLANHLFLGSLQPEHVKTLYALYAGQKEPEVRAAFITYVLPRLGLDEDKRRELLLAQLKDLKPDLDARQILRLIKNSAAQANQAEINDALKAYLKKAAEDKSSSVDWKAEQGKLFD